MLIDGAFLYDYTQKHIPRNNQRLMSSSDTLTATGLLAYSGLRFVGSYRNEVHFASSDIIPLLLHATSPNPNDIPCLQ